MDRSAVDNGGQAAGSQGWMWYDQHVNPQHARGEPLRKPTLKRGTALGGAWARTVDRRRGPGRDVHTIPLHEDRGWPGPGERLVWSRRRCSC